MNDTDTEKRQFSIRLDGEILEKFNKIKAAIGITADVEVLRYIIKTYEQNTDKIQKMQNDIEILKAQFSRLKV